MSLDWESIPRPPRVGDDEELERRAIEALLHQLGERKLHQGGKYQPRRCRRCQHQFEPGDFYFTVRTPSCRWAHYCDSCAAEQRELLERP